MLFQQRLKKVGNIDNQMKGQGSFRHADTQSKGSEQNDGRGGYKMRQGLRSGGVYRPQRGTLDCSQLHQEILLKF